MSTTNEEHVESLLDFGDEAAEEQTAEAPAEEQQEEQQEQPRSRYSERVQALANQKNELAGENEDLKNQLQQQQQSMAKLKEAVEALAASRQPEQKEEAPDFLEDPKGYVDMTAAQMKKQLEDLKEEAQNGNIQAQQEMAKVQFLNALQGDEQTFSQANPDYYDALDYLREQRAQELEDLGLNQDEIARTINTEEIQAAAVAVQRGTSAAQYAYNRAKKLGYTPEQKSDGDVEAQADRMARLQSAGSLGGSGLPAENASVDSPEEEAWAPIEEAFQELFGQSLS